MSRRSYEVEPCKNDFNAIGDYGEIQSIKELERIGFKAHQADPSSPTDILIEFNDRYFNCQVKTGIYDDKTGTYKFNIDTKKYPCYKCAFFMFADRDSEAVLIQENSYRITSSFSYRDDTFHVGTATRKWTSKELAYEPTSMHRVTAENVIHCLERFLVIEALYYANEIKELMTNEALLTEEERTINCDNDPYDKNYIVEDTNTTYNDETIDNAIDDQSVPLSNKKVGIPKIRSSKKKGNILIPVSKPRRTKKKK